MARRWRGRRVGVRTRRILGTLLAPGLTLVIQLLFTQQSPAGRVGVARPRRRRQHPSHSRRRLDDLHRDLFLHDERGERCADQSADQGHGADPDGRHVVDVEHRPRGPGRLRLDRCLDDLQTSPRPDGLGRSRFAQALRRVPSRWPSIASCSCNSSQRSSARLATACASSHKVRFRNIGGHRSMVPAQTIP